MGNCGNKSKSKNIPQVDSPGAAVASPQVAHATHTTGDGGGPAHNDNHDGTNIPPGRRRLSVSQAAPVRTDADDVAKRGTIVRKQTTDWKEFLPKSRRRISISGAPAIGMQKGFENKDVAEHGDEEVGPAVNALRVGFACKKGLKPESPNQDDFFDFQVDDWGMYGVFDGHGPAGHDISNYVHKHLPKRLFAHADFESNPLRALKEVFVKIHQECKNQAEEQNSFDCALSGTTATVVLQRDDTLHVAHVGDSRAIIGRVTDAHTYTLLAEDLTDDHKPTDEREQKRIVASGGEVRRLEGDIPHRVFVKGKLYPGLAMSRAIGDVVGSFVGVSCEPDVATRVLTQSDKFFALCSDGVWEFISSQEAADIIAKEGPHGCHVAAEKLAQEAWRRWVVEEENIVDDITVLVRWLIPDP